MYASQKVQISSILRRPKTDFRHVQGGQRGSAITGPINNIQNTNNTAHEVEHQKTVTKKKLGKRTKWFSEVIEGYIIITRGKTSPQDAQTSETNLHRTKRISHCASDTCLPCAFLSSVFCSRCFILRFSLVQ